MSYDKYHMSQSHTPGCHNIASHDECGENSTQTM